MATRSEALRAASSLRTRSDVLEAFVVGTGEECGVMIYLKPSSSKDACNPPIPEEIEGVEIAIETAHTGAAA